MDSKYIQRLLKKPNQSFFLFGPRGTGKTTWVKKEFPEACQINLLDESLYQSYLGNISLFADQLRALTPDTWVFVDEIQRLPNLLNEVHRFIEDNQLRFILTGSSARKLKKTGVNLLAGRALYRKLYPFLPAELGKVFTLDQALKTGTIPLICKSTDKKETLLSYVQMYLKEEIKGEALVRNLPGFVRFLPIAAVMHGQSVNLANAARDAGISRTTISGYMEILEDTLLAFRLNAFESKLRVRERKHPKFYWVDPGVVRAINHRFGEIQPDEKGPLFEGFIAGLLRTYQEYYDLFDDMFFWSPAEAQDTEVDFLIRRNDQFIAMEVKSGDKIFKQHLKGLRAISGLPGIKRRVLIYDGETEQKTQDGIDIWPFETFNQSLIQNTLWP
jgi:predicted AAA+ superfamily ATPase